MRPLPTGICYRLPQHAQRRTWRACCLPLLNCIWTDPIHHPLQRAPEPGSERIVVAASAPHASVHTTRCRRTFLALPPRCGKGLPMGYLRPRLVLAILALYAVNARSQLARSFARPEPGSLASSLVRQALAPCAARLVRSFARHRAGAPAQSLARSLARPPAPGRLQLVSLARSLATACWVGSDARSLACESTCLASSLAAASCSTEASSPKQGLLVLWPHAERAAHCSASTLLC